MRLAILKPSLCAFVALMLLSPLAYADDQETPDLVQWYGFLRVDGIYSDSKLNNIQTPQWAELEPDGAPDDDAELSIHPRLTRLGVDIAPQKLVGLTTSGKIEIDFQNGGGEARQVIRMRHAFVELRHEIFELLAGQTWDLISPLNPMANNDTLMWNTGNLGDRRPQVRGSVVLPARGGALRIAAMAGQTGAVDGQDFDGDGRADGQESGVPTAQGLIEFRRRGFRVGAWVHGGFESVATPVNDIDGFSSWAAGAHIHAPFQERLYVRAELHRGRNMTDVRGGIGQAINATTGEGIHSSGGWAEIGAKIRDPYTISVGIFVENPDDEDLDDGGRELNYAYAIGQRIRPHERLLIGIDYIFWKTDYKNLGSGAANRGNVFLQTSF